MRKLQMKRRDRGAGVLHTLFLTWSGFVMISRLESNPVGSHSQGFASADPPRAQAEPVSVNSRRAPQVLEEKPSANELKVGVALADLGMVQAKVGSLISADDQIGLFPRESLHLGRASALDGPA